jgi:hypothetical protein
VIGRKTFDLERQRALKDVGGYVVDLVGVHFVRNIHKGVRRGTGKSSKSGRHHPTDL